MDYVIDGAEVILGDDLVEASVTVANGAIAALDRGGGRSIDARGLLLAPAMVDIHGDAFERQVMPRPGVFFPTDTAILETDRQLATNGIATAYHALTLSWEPGLRSLERSEAFVDGLEALADRLGAEHRLQLRWETFAFEALDLIDKALVGRHLPSIAFNDHTSMTMRAFDMKVTERPFQLADEQIAALDDPRMARRLDGIARRAGRSTEDYAKLLGEVWARRAEVDAAVRGVADKGRRVGAPMLSHDDSNAEMREYYAGLGATIAEFPMCETTAREAKARGEWVVLGAPNTVRGGSHIGSLDAADMVEAGVCDILASDYYYPAMLAAIARLANERRAPLPKLWRQVATNPAAASGLHDRGLIEPGRRADLVLLDWPSGGAPTVVMTMVAGRIVHLAKDLLH